MIGFIDILYTVLGTTSNYSRIADLHSSQFTVTHTLGFSVFTSRILVTDLQQSHCHIKSRMKFSFHSLIPVLPLFFNCQLSSSALTLISWQAAVSKLDSTLNGLNWTLLYNHFARTTQKTQSLYCWEGVFTAQLPSNGSYSNVACVFNAAGMCLSSRCLAMNVSSDFTVPAVGRRVIMFERI
jgi:hypothetical protein